MLPLRTPWDSFCDTLASSRELGSWEARARNATRLHLIGQIGSREGEGVRGARSGEGVYQGSILAKPTKL